MRLGGTQTIIGTTVILFWARNAIGLPAFSWGLSNQDALRGREDV